MKFINVIFMNSDLTIIGNDCAYESMIFNHKFQNYGDFELVTVSYDEKLHKINNYIFINQDVRKIGIIKSVKRNDLDGLKAVIKGYTLTYLYNERITLPMNGKEYWETTHKASIAIRSLIAANTYANRSVFKDYYPTNYPVVGREITIKTRYDNLLNVVIDSCIRGNVGISVKLHEFSDGTRNISHVIYEGVDRTSGNGVNDEYRFNVKYKNMYNRNYTEDDSEYRNCAYVAGQGEGVNRRVITVGDENKNYNRHEIFVDARDLDTDAKLRQRGYDKLSECQKIRSYEFETYAKDWKKKYDLGDIVTIIDEEFGVSENKVINGVRESIDSTGQYIELTLGIPQKTIGEIVKNISGGNTGGSSTTGATSEFSNAFGVVDVNGTLVQAYAPNSKIGVFPGTKMSIDVQNHSSTASAKSITMNVESSIHTYQSKTKFPLIPKPDEKGDIFIDKENNETYRWDDEAVQYICIGFNGNNIKIINGGNAE